MYYVYILRCADDSLYTGLTNNPERRLRQHQRKINGGARYTAIKPAIEYAALWETETRRAAARLEYAIKKKFSHEQKEMLISGNLPLPVADASIYLRVNDLSKQTGTEANVRENLTNSQEPAADRSIYDEKKEVMAFVTSCDFEQPSAEQSRTTDEYLSYAETQLNSEAEH